MTTIRRVIHAAYETAIYIALALLVAIDGDDGAEFDGEPK
jgi:hypothetical protein